MPKFNKTKGFSLKSGNKPTFQQMGSSISPGKMYNAPLKAEDDEVKKDEEAPKVEDKKETAKPADKLGVKIAKIAANAAIGGFDAVTGHTTKRPTVNFGPDKAEEEAETLTIGQKMLKDDYKLGDLAKDKKDKEKKSEYSGFGYDPNYKNPFKK